jgi:hypothetical protein
MANVIATPGDVFEEVRVAPVTAGNWLIPALIFIVLSWIGSTLLLTQPDIKQQITEMVEKGLRQQYEKMHMPKDKIEDAIKTTEKWLEITTLIGSYAGPPLAAFLSVFGWGLVVWLIGTKVHKSDFEYMKAVEVVGLGNTIGVLDVIVRTLLILATRNVFASPSLAMLVKDFNPQNPTHSLLAMANVMTIWILAVRSIGLARLAKVAWFKAVAWIFGIWAAYSGSFWALGQLGQMFGKRMSGS